MDAVGVAVAKNTQAAAMQLNITTDTPTRRLVITDGDTAPDSIGAWVWFMASFHDSRIAHRGHEPAQRRSADSLVRELVEVGSRGQSCPRSGQRFMERINSRTRQWLHGSFRRFTGVEART
jgi:hypothetical protein